MPKRLHSVLVKLAGKSSPIGQPLHLHQQIVTLGVFAILVLEGLGGWQCVDGVEQVLNICKMSFVNTLRATHNVYVRFN